MRRVRTLWLLPVVALAATVPGSSPSLGDKPVFCFESASHLFSFGDPEYRMEGWLSRLELDSTVQDGHLTARLIQRGPDGTDTSHTAWRWVGDTVVVQWADAFATAEWQFVVDDHEAIGWAAGTTDQVQLDSTGVYRLAQYRRVFKAPRVLCY